MHLCNMLIYLPILCLELCGAIQDRKYALQAVTTYFKYFACMRGQRTTLPSDCQVSAGPPRRGMFAGQSDRKPLKVNPPNRSRCGGSYACACHPVYAVNCDSAVSYDAYRNHESRMIHTIASLFTFLAMR